MRVLEELMSVERGVDAFTRKIGLQRASVVAALS
jgi:hypothetical protein